jgi:hypothetical protein
MEERNGYGEFGDGRACAQQAAFDLDAEHVRCLRVATLAADGKADLSGVAIQGLSFPCDSSRAP